MRLKINYGYIFYFVKCTTQIKKDSEKNCRNVHAKVLEEFSLLLHVPHPFPLLPYLQSTASSRSSTTWDIPILSLPSIRETLLPPNLIVWESKFEQINEISPNQATQKHHQINWAIFTMTSPARLLTSKLTCLHRCWIMLPCYLWHCHATKTLKSKNVIKAKMMSGRTGTNKITQPCFA